MNSLPTIITACLIGWLVTLVLAVSLVMANKLPGRKL